MVKIKEVCEFGLRNQRDADAVTKNITYTENSLVIYSLEWGSSEHHSEQQGLQGSNSCLVADCDKVLIWQKKLILHNMEWWMWYKKKAMEK